MLGSFLPSAFAVAKAGSQQRRRLGKIRRRWHRWRCSLVIRSGSLHKQPVLLVGAGKMAELVARHLLAAEVHPLWIVNPDAVAGRKPGGRAGWQAHPF